MGILLQFSSGTISSWYGLSSPIQSSMAFGRGGMKGLACFEDFFIDSPE